jgi:hypothetical protein
MFAARPPSPVSHPPGAPSKKYEAGTSSTPADLLQSAGADAVHTLLIFLNLLEGEAQVTAEDLLRHVDLNPPHTDAPADMDIDRIRGLCRHLELQRLRQPG